MICPEPHSQEQNLTLQGSSLASCTTGGTASGWLSGIRSWEAEWGGVLCEQEVLVCFLGLCPARNSLTRVALCIPQADGHSCAKPAGPRASFAAREAPWRAAGAGVGQEGLFLELIPLLLGVLRRGPKELLVAQRGSGENLGSGFCRGVQAGL